MKDFDRAATEALALWQAPTAALAAIPRQLDVFDQMLSGPAYATRKPVWHPFTHQLVGAVAALVASNLIVWVTR